MARDHWDAVLASKPLNATAGRVAARHEGPMPVGPAITTQEWDAPPPFVSFKAAAGSDQVDIRGHRFGRLTVIGYLGDGKWCCRCVCGRYVLRRQKAALNPANGKDRCTNCRHTAYLQEQTSAEQTKRRRLLGEVQLP